MSIKCLFLFSLFFIFSFNLLFAFIPEWRLSLSLHKHAWPLLPVDWAPLHILSFSEVGTVFGVLMGGWAVYLFALTWVAERFLDYLRI